MKEKYLQRIRLPTMHILCTEGPQLTTARTKAVLRTEDKPDENIISIESSGVIVVAFVLRNGSRAVVQQFKLQFEFDTHSSGLLLTLKCYSWEEIYVVLRDAQSCEQCYNGSWRHSAIVAISYCWLASTLCPMMTLWTARSVSPVETLNIGTSSLWDMNRIYRVFLFTKSVTLCTPEENLQDAAFECYTFQSSSITCSLVTATL